MEDVSYRLMPVHEARPLLAEEIGKFTLERVSENGEVRILHAWVVPGDRIATVVQGSSAYH